MNKLMIGVLVFGSLSASADDLVRRCGLQAERATAKATRGRYYDRDGFMTHQCGLAPNKAVVLCDVSASKGNGAAIDGYRVVLSRDCKRVFRVDLMDEE